MKAKQFTSALKRLRINYSGAARFLEKDRTTIRRYKAGGLPIPVPIAMLLALMVRHQAEPNEVRKLAGLDPVPLDLPVGRRAEPDDE